MDTIGTATKCRILISEMHSFVHMYYYVAGTIDRRAGCTLITGALNNYYRASTVVS